MDRPLLAIETATNVCGVALVQDGRVTVSLHLHRPRAHAENLVPFIRDALRYGGLEAQALGAVAVSKGPGSYTGLRIGVSTAKGLALATDAALVAVPTLEALAASVAPQAQAGDLVLAALDARRDEVYAAAFHVSDAGALSEHTETAALAVGRLPAWLSASGERVWLVGNGASKAASALEDAGYERLHLLDEASHAPSADWIAHLGLRRLEAGTVEDVAAFEPYYLKEFVATERQGSVFDQLPST